MRYSKSTGTQDLLMSLPILVKIALAWTKGNRRGANRHRVASSGQHQSVYRQIDLQSSQTGKSVDGRSCHCDRRRAATHPGPASGEGIFISESGEAVR